MTTTSALVLPKFMREEILPRLPESLEVAIASWIEQNPKLSAIRSAAYSALKKVGLPHSASEDYSFIRVGEVLPHLGSPAEVPKTVLPDPVSPNSERPKADLPSVDTLIDLIVPECKNNFIVILNGRFEPSISKLGPGLSVDRLEGNGKPQLLSQIAAESDALAALAMLFAFEPIRIQITAKAVLPSPLQILHFQTLSPNLLTKKTTDAKSGRRLDTFLLIEAATLSESKILVRHATAKGMQTPEALTNMQTLVCLEESASMTFQESGLTTNDTQAKSQTLRFQKLSAHLERNSRLFTVSAQTGSRLTRNSFAVDLLGQGADAEINCAAVLTGKNQSHQFARIRHLVPHCTSRQHFKSVAADEAKSSVDGTIFVAKDAQGTNAHQLINNLMLSDEARTDSKPQLMIYADDVKCAHGATTGKLDSAQRFYLLSRGLRPDQALNLMTVAFIAEILEKADGGNQKGSEFKSGFRSLLEHDLLDTLKTRLPTGASESQPFHA